MNAHTDPMADQVVPAPDRGREISLRNAVDASRDAFWDWDVDGGSIVANRRWFELRELPSQTNLPMPLSAWRDHVHPDDLPQVMAALTRHLDGESDHYEAEYRVIAGDGRTRWVFDRGSIVSRDDCGRPTRLAGLNTDIDVRKRQESEQTHVRSLIDVVQHVQRDFIRHKSIKASAETMLKAVLDVTGSDYGFIAEVLRDDQNQTYLLTHALTDISWNDATRKLFKEMHAAGLEFRNHATLFGYTLRTGQALITNDPSHHPECGGTPHGHPPLNSYAGIPVHSGDMLVGMIGIANRPGGFDEAVVKRLEPLVATFAVLVEAQTSERERAASERATAAASARMIETKKRLRNVTNSIPGAVCQWLTRNARFERLLFVSNGVRALAGLEPDALMATPRLALRLLAPALRRELVSTMFHHARCVTPWSLEFQLMASDDAEPTWVRLAVMPRMVDATCVEWSGVVVDISETKHMEAQLRMAKEAADSANRAKSAFLASMSHEIRTPIHAMLGYLELLQNSPLQNSQQRQVAVIGESTHTLLSLLDDILDFSRIEAGKLGILPEAVDMQALLDRNQGAWAEAAARRGLRLTMVSRLASATQLVMDPVRVQQIFSNLMSNAIKFTPDGSITISADWLPASGAQPAQFHFSVTDTGIGMPKSVQERVFQPFEQADGETSRSYGGSGLGLAISRRLAGLLGGRLELESEPGVGTCVRLIIPAPRVEALQAEPRVRAPDENPAAVPLRARLAVLVVEDNPTNRNLVVCQLEELGIQATALDNGEAALAEWQRGQYDLILSDCHMPGLDGFELARRIRRLEHEQQRVRVPIIAFTADAFHETELACREAGMDDYVAKPVSIADVQNALRRWGGGDASGIVETPVVPAAPPVALIDKAALDRITGDIPWLRRKALTLFCKNLEPGLTRLEHAVRALNPSSIAAESHSLLGAARTIGATPLSDAAWLLMQTARNPSPIDAAMLKAQYAGISVAAAQTRIAVTDLLDEH